MINDEECQLCDTKGWGHNCTRCKEWHEHGLVHINDSSQRHWLCDKCWVKICEPDDDDMKLFSETILRH